MQNQLPTFDKGAASCSLLPEAWVQGLRLLWCERAGGGQFAHAIDGALEGGLGIVDGADNSRQGWRGATVAPVHTGAIPQAVQFALHPPSEVALSPVVQALHARRYPGLSVENTCVSLLGMLLLSKRVKWSRAVWAVFEQHLQVVR